MTRVCDAASIEVKLRHAAGWAAGNLSAGSYNPETSFPLPGPLKWFMI